MTAATVRRALGLAALAAAVAAPPGAPAATPAQVDAAVARGTAFLRRNATADANNTPGSTFLAGLALLESGVAADDPAIGPIVSLAREHALTEVRTYHVALCLLLLDRIGDPADRPLVQLLGSRLLLGQTGTGGWGYNTAPPLPAGDGPRLRTALAAGRTDGLHPEVERYARLASTTFTRPPTDDNSNTQFAVIGLWVARQHGVPVEAALAAVEQRFLASQTPPGGWGYMFSAVPANDSPVATMTCAGLLGMATALARRDDRKLAPPPPPPAPKAPAAPPRPTTDDPFFNPPKAAPADRGPKPPPAAPAAALDFRDAAAARGLSCLAGFLGNGYDVGGHTLYYLWSVERVGVVYGVERIGAVDWYAGGSDYLLREQATDGSWSNTDGPVVGTSFALLFLTRSNLTRTLKARKGGSVEGVLRAGGGRNGPGWDVNPVAPGGKGVASDPVAVEAAALAGKLAATTDADWKAAVAAHRDAKGTLHTRVLVTAAGRVGADRRKDVRDALADRLSRMTAATLRGMLAADEPELRRAAALACGMKDDKTHLADLIPLLTDGSDAVWPAAKASLKSLTGEDLGPPVTATPADRAKAAAAWKAWLAARPK